MDRFTLKVGSWYACKLIGDEFDEDKCSYSPIKVLGITPRRNGNRSFLLQFYHHNYPEGVRDKAYELETIERGETLILARSTEHSPPRFLQLYDITPDWISRHCPDADLF